MKNLTEYVVELLKVDTERVIKKHASITVENDVFDRFIDARDANRPPQVSCFLPFRCWERACKGAVERP